VSLYAVAFREMQSLRALVSAAFHQPNNLSDSNLSPQFPYPPLLPSPLLWLGWGGWGQATVALESLVADGREKRSSDSWIPLSGRHLDGLQVSIQLRH
jgi:hypothetical protein